nr:pilus assembly protein [Actinoplanes regularis]
MSSALVLAFAVVQAGFVYYAHSVALGAATQGVNAARGYNSSAGAGQAHAEAFLSQAGSGLVNQHVTVSRNGDRATVVVTGKAVSVLPGLTFSVRKTAYAPVELVTAP